MRGLLPLLLHRYVCDECNDQYVCDERNVMNMCDECVNVIIGMCVMDVCDVMNV